MPYETYLTNDDPQAHVDFPPLVANERGSAALAIPEGCVVCPKCLGWGGHNLIVNAYPLRAGIEDTAEHRHRYAHFRCQCNQCNGWGYVVESDSHCVHEWRMGRNLGRCLNEWVCVKCPAVREVDSSD